MGNPIPSQLRTVDPFDSFDSNVVNRITRLVTMGKNMILSHSPFDVSILNPTTLHINGGMAVKDDVLIEITAPIDIDCTNINSYVNSGTGTWNEVGNYYLVLNYVYSKSLPAPQATFGLILPSQRINPAIFNTMAMLLIKVVNVQLVSGSNQIVSISDFDSDNPANSVPSNIVPPTNVTTATYTVKPTDTSVVCNPIANQTIILPAASSISSLSIVNPSLFTITIQTSGTDTIQGATSVVLSNQYDTLNLLSDKVHTFYKLNTAAASVATSAPPSTITGSTYTIQPTDSTLVCKPTSNQTLILPAASTVTKLIPIINATTFPITIMTSGTDTIQGATSVVLSNQYDSMNLLSDHVNTFYKLIVTSASAQSATITPPTTVTGATYTVQSTDNAVICKPTVNQTITLLPSISGNPVKIINLSAFTITILPAGTDTIEGLTSLTLIKEYDSVSLTNDLVSTWVTV